MSEIDNIETGQSGGESGFSDRPAARQADGRVMLGENIEIYPGRVRADLASPGTQAFDANDKRIAGEQVAMLCGRAIVPRLMNIGSYRNLKNTAILRLLDAGVVSWTPEGRERFAFIFEKPPPRKLMATFEDKPHHFAEDKIMPLLVEPILEALATLRNIDLVHGAINPMNIFIAGADGAENVMLGECLTSAPSWRQHALFEPIERAMAQPTGRGAGTAKDDLYAFGMCVALAARGENFVKGKTQEQVIQMKLADGSYALAVGGMRLPAGVSEFLRGTLNDDETLRWDIEEATRWLDGRRQSPKQPRAYISAARPFVFKETKHRNLRSLADAFSRNVGEAAQTIEQDQFDLWIKRNFEDVAILKRLEEVWEREKASGRDKLVTSTCMALDPLAPVRYKGVSAFPGGFGNALADAMARGDDVQVYGEIISQQMFSNWINLRFDEVFDATGLLTQFEKCRNYLTQKILGYGLERVLYTLNKECVCMSPLLKDYFVIGPGRLLMALEDLAKKGVRPEGVFDRHMVAFISVREPKMIDPWLGHIISHDRSNQVLGYVRTLAMIQRRFNTGPLPALTSWMASLGTVAIERFHNGDLKQELIKRIGRVAGTGNLAQLLELIDNGNVVQEDAQQYAQAQREYIFLEREKMKIAGYLNKRRTFGFATGRQAAMIVSAGFSSLCVVGYIVYFFMQRML